MVASRFDRVYPGGGRIFFDGGKNNNYDPALIEDNESPDCLNVWVEQGSVETRTGYQKLNTATVGTLVANGLYTRHTNSGAESMVAFWGQHMYVLSGTTFNTVPSAQSVFTVNVRVATTEYENYMFIGNGLINPYKYNEHFTTHGIPAPTVTATAASQATGVLTGDFYYAYTNVNSALVESDISPINATFTAASATIRVSNITAAPASHGVIARRLYRVEAGGTDLKRVATINDNTTLFYDDNIPDASLGVDAPIDQGEPPQYSTCITHQNRIFCDDPANPSFVWYSELANPYVFKTTNFIRIGNNTNDIVQGFQIYDNSLVVFCKLGQYIVYMPSTTPTDWRTIQVRSPYSSRSPFGSFHYENKVMFPAVQNDKFVGMAAISGDSIDPSASFLTVSAMGSDLKTDRVELDMFDVQETYIRNITSIVFKNRSYTSLTKGLSQTTNNYIYVFDFSFSRINRKQEGAWLPWFGHRAEQFTVYNGKLYFIGSDSDGFVYEMNVDGLYTDDGNAINSYYWTKEFSGIKGDENIEKDFRYAGILFENSGAYYMDLNFRVNSDDSEGNQVQIDLNPGGGLWGSLVWGTDPWGGGLLNNEIRQYLGQLRGKRIQFRFSNQNTINQKFKIIGMNFVYNNKGLR